MRAERVRPAWKMAEADYRRVRELAQALRAPSILAHVLLVRGIATAAEAERFLHPSLENLSDPFALMDMDKAVERLKRAKASSERVLVFGDYDVDGVSASAILVRALRRFGIEHVTYDMPNRLTDGFGLNAERVEQAKREGVDLIVTVDNGTSACDAGRCAKALGIDLIITDHHQLDEEMCEAVALVNPNREKDGHPARYACGTTMAFKLATALAGEIEDLDLVALGTVADIVPLLGENRDLVAAGLDWSARFPRVGLQALARVAGISLKELDAEQIAFQLAPRINAAGRLGDGRVGLELLLTDNPLDADRLARHLNAANEERRRIEDQVLREAEALLHGRMHGDLRSIVLGSRDWHPGVLGIVASRVQARYHMPVVLVAFDENGLGRGSARSVEHVDVSRVLACCQDHLVKYGGHRAAAGMTVVADQFEHFRTRFEAEVADCSPNGVTPQLYLDAPLSLSEIDGRLVSALDMLRPFGCQNPAPLFGSFNVRVLPRSIRMLRDAHLRLTVGEGPRSLVAMGFNMADRLSEIATAPAVDIAFTPRLNTWRGETTIQLYLKDIRPAEGE